MSTRHASFTFVFDHYIRDGGGSNLASGTKCGDHTGLPMAAQLKAERIRELKSKSWSLESSTRRIEELEAENATLRSKVTAQQECLLSENGSFHSNETVSLQKHQSLIRKYDDLRARFDKLSREQKRSEQALQRAAVKCKDVKALVNGWKAFMEEKGLFAQENEPNANVRLESPELSRFCETSDLVTGLQDDITPGQQPAKHIWPSRSDSSTTLPTSNDDTAGLLHPTSDTSDGIAKADAGVISRYCGSSQTTDDAVPSSPPLPTAVEDDDVPVFVSAKSLKRRRSNPRNEMPPPVRIKQETTDSDRSILTVSDHTSDTQFARPSLTRAETSDLDALVEHVQTPRKKRHGRPITSDDSSITTMNLMPLLRPISRTSIPPAVVPDEIEHVKIKTEHRPHPNCGSYARRATSPLPIKKIHKSTTMLASLSPNVPVSPRRQKPQNQSKLKRLSDSSIDKVFVLSEDGENHKSQDMLPPDQMADHQGQHRLRDLLNNPTPDKKMLNRRPTPEPRFIKRKEQEHLHPNNSTPQKQISRKVANSKIKRPQSPRNPSNPEDGSLRSRPLKHLHLDDFRINPRYMDSEFAFADSLRSKASKKCAQGCTREECCGGAFRRLVELNALPAAERTANSPEEKPSDTEILEDYLGPQWAELVGAYESVAQRADLLMQARAFAFANAHGKHRTAFTRHSTPPGFWRTDMPSTQEEREDRFRAGEMERNKVEERWREAMRENGRWKFRDE